MPQQKQYALLSTAKCGIVLRSSSQTRECEEHASILPGGNAIRVASIQLPVTLACRTPCL